MLKKIDGLSKGKDISIFNTFKMMFNETGHIIEGIEVGKYSDTKLSISAGKVITNKLDVIQNDTTEIIDINDIMSERRLATIPDGIHSLLVISEPNPNFLLLITDDNAPTNFTFIKNIEVSSGKIQNVLDGSSKVIKDTISKLNMFQVKAPNSSDAYRVPKLIETKSFSGVNSIDYTFDTSMYNNDLNEFLLVISGKTNYEGGGAHTNFKAYINGDQDSSHYTNDPNIARLGSLNNTDTVSFIYETQIANLSDRITFVASEKLRTYVSDSTYTGSGGDGFIYNQSGKITSLQIIGEHLNNCDCEIKLYAIVDSNQISSPANVPDPQILNSDTILTVCGIYLVDTNSGDINITLPLANSLSTCKLYIKNIGTNKVFVNIQGTDTIDNETSYTLATKNEAIDLVNDTDTNTWYIL